LLFGKKDGEEQKGDNRRVRRMGNSGGMLFKVPEGENKKMEKLVVRKGNHSRKTTE